MMFLITYWFIFSSSKSFPWRNNRIFASILKPTKNKIPLSATINFFQQANSQQKTVTTCKVPVDDSCPRTECTNSSLNRYMMTCLDVATYRTWTIHHCFLLWNVDLPNIKSIWCLRQSARSQNIFVGGILMEYLYTLKYFHLCPLLKFVLVHCTC